MQKDVILTIKGLYVSSDTQDSLEFETHARLDRNEDGYLITYETPDAGLPLNGKTTISVSDDSMSFLRDGSDYNFVFESGKTFVADMRLFDRRLNMSLTPTKLKTDLSCSSGSVNLEYLINVNGSESVNQIDLKYKTLKQASSSIIGGEYEN